MAAVQVHAHDIAAMFTHRADASEPRPAAIRPHRARRLLMAADVLSLLVAIAVAMLLQAWLRPVAVGTVERELALALLCVPVWIGVFSWRRLYAARYVSRFSEEMRRLVQAVVIGATIVLGLGFFLHFEDLSRLWITLVFVCAFVALAAERRIARAWFVKLRRNRRLVRRVALIGTNREAEELARTFAKHPELGYEVVGFVGEDELVARRGGAPLLGPIDNAERILRQTGIEGVIVAVTAVDAEATNRLTRKLTDASIHVEISSALQDIAVERFQLQTHGGRPMVYVEPTIRSGWRAVAKRTFDIAFSLVALLVASPVLLVAAVLIKLDGGPVFFRQERVGLDGRRFRLVKLRSMSTDAEARKAELLAMNESDGPLFKMKHDPRITKVGRVLRKFSIDEIPQFWNVLRGEMSVVGPRPALSSEMQQWSPALLDRLRVKPGITGSWQVSGRSDASFDEYQRLDLYYVDNWSLSHDLSIVLKTVPAVLASRGAA